MAGNTGMNGQTSSPIETGPVRGFTLLELLVTLAIIAIIASIAIPAYSSYAINTRQSVAVSKLNRIAIAMEQYYTDYRSYAVSLETLKIPDKDSWYQYTIEQADRSGFKLVATPKSNTIMTTILGLDHLGRRQSRQSGEQDWQSGWP